ncbi:glycosyltransferase family 2 protein [Candidatus Avelusimicrobium caledoniensis]|uniref:glycosyltransferase family 2 protein n=1 Tax=Candidatus Avelusimicrobium caledoniensis TaxID=3416220 RepID=UPI003D0C381B
MIQIPLISVIVPVYNVAAYLPRCLDSILAQTYKNLEIILVDDGSTDNSLEICQQYAQKDNRIKIIHQENKGLPGARNTGLNNMQGDFVAFVDSDDWIPPQAYSTLYDLHKRTGADVMWGSLLYSTTRGSRIPAHFHLPTNDQERLCLVDVLCTGNMLCVDKIYIASLFTQNLRFNERLTYSEDLDFILRLLQKANFVAFTKQTVYYYFMRPDSITHTPSLHKLSDDIHVWHKIYSFTKRKHVDKALVPITRMFVGVLCVFLMAVILYDKRGTYIYSFQQTRTWLRHHLKDILFNSPMGWPGKIFILFPLYFPRVAKWTFHLPWLYPFLHQQFNARIAPKSATL